MSAMEMTIEPSGLEERMQEEGGMMMTEEEGGTTPSYPALSAQQMGVSKQ